MALFPTIWRHCPLCRKPSKTRVQKEVSEGRYEVSCGKCGYRWPTYEPRLTAVQKAMVKANQQYGPALQRLA